MTLPRTGHTRRLFLSAALVGLPAKAERPIAGGFADDYLTPGHKLRDRWGVAPPARQERPGIVIVGAGIAGLLAAWHLEKRGYRDYVILEMQDQAGGNSRWGESEVSPYPWAAHYVPVPGPGAALARELFTELGLLRDGHWDERHLCHDPQERLFLHGRWQEGLEPELGATSEDHRQYRRFQETVGEMRASGEFTIPSGAGPRKLAHLDRLSVAAWLRQNRFDSPYLLWYLDYCCRDDYGSAAGETSAWAGIHYFAAREHEEKGPLTWPQGNGWIVQRLMERLAPRVRLRSTVMRIARQGTRFRVLTESTAYLAEVVIFAAPTYLAHYMVEDFPPAGGFQYPPWMTANLTLERPPAEKGFPVAWDNVLYKSPSLGYVVATHQSLAARRDRSVWTYYWALAPGSPTVNRHLLLEPDWAWWRDAILSDLSQAHPDIRSCVSRIDILRQGHAMISPVPGFLSSDARKRLAEPSGRFILANSDLSGLSLFEEAQFRGTEAARHALRVLGRA